MATGLQQAKTAQDLASISSSLLLASTKLILLQDKGETPNAEQTTKLIKLLVGSAEIVSDAGVSLVSGN